LSDLVISSNFVLSTRVKSEPHSILNFSVEIFVSYVNDTSCLSYTIRTHIEYVYIKRTVFYLILTSFNLNCIYLRASGANLFRFVISLAIILIMLIIHIN